MRQSVTRSRKAGFTASLHKLGELSEDELGSSSACRSAWRGDEPERGFSMAIDWLRGDHLGESAVVLARDGDGEVRGFLHFVPCYGRSAMSLGLMRRERDSVNGLMEFLIVSAIELLREQRDGGAVAQLRGLRPPASQPGGIASKSCSAGW